MCPPCGTGGPGTMSTGVNAAVRAPAVTARQHRLRRGRTRILALSDLTMLALAYAVSYLIADRIAPLPPVSGSAWFLALVAVTAPFVWLTVFTANKLYDNDSLKISVSSFDEIARPLPRDARRLARLSAPVAGGRPLLRLVGLHAGRGLHLPCRRARC